MRPRIWTSPVALAVTFDNSTNGFVAAETQSAIEEAKSASIANDRFPFLFSRGGSAENKWLDTVSGISSAQTPLYVFENFIVRTVTVAYQKITNHAPELYVDGVLAHTLTVTGATYGYATGLSIAITAGSYLSVFSPSKSAGAANPPRNEIYTVFLQKA